MNKKKVIEFLDKSIARLLKIYNNSPVIRDDGVDITEVVKGQAEAYIEVKSFIEKGSK